TTNGSRRYAGSTTRPGAWNATRAGPPCPNSSTGNVANPPATAGAASMAGKSPPPSPTERRRLAIAFLCLSRRTESPTVVGIDDHRAMRGIYGTARQQRRGKGKFDQQFHRRFRGVGRRAVYGVIGAITCRDGNPSRRTG